jgi:hypothetical protein
MLGNMEGVTRQAIKYYLNKRGIDTSKANAWILVKCFQCGLEFKKVRSTVRNKRRIFCTEGCYYKAIANPNYHQGRWHQVLARRVVGEIFKLETGMVVHHEDGNNKNNDPVNLMVFANQGDHMRWHRLGGADSGVIPLWRGDECR